MKSSNQPPARSSGLRRFLYFTSAVTGAAILVVEILGAKMLSPFIGSSHFVWTAQIAVTLISLALGYYFGGRLVDHSPKLSRLYTCIALAALYLALTVPLVDKVAYACLRFNLAVGALFASAFLFLIPLTLLAATGPFLIRVLTQTVETVGGQVGRLSAISTLGSVLGTVLIGYALLPFLPNSTTMFVTAGVLLALVAAYFIGFARKDQTLLQSGVLILMGYFAIIVIFNLIARPYNNTKRLFFGNSNFGQIEVIEHKQGPNRFYLNDFLVQNTYDARSKKSLSLFNYMLHDLAFGYHGPLTNTLCIGMGIGIVPGMLTAQGVHVDIVEINPAIVPVAREFFDFKDANTDITIGDGRFFINKSTNRYDAVFLDAFLGDSSPSHLMTRESFREIARLLGNDGVLVINSFGDFRRGHDFFVASLDKTLKSVFKDVRIHASGNGNVFFAASQKPMVLKPQPSPGLPPGSRLESDYNTAIVQAPPPDPASGIILTDDFNPVDFYDAPNRERFRRMLAMSMRDL